jgi:tetratricopeptide (TPR) repeat protein/predicted Ser/Thr protein kinase
MALSPGDKLGPYEVLALIGKGGMGEVYKARDTRLDRIVAVKVSRAEFSQRFEREARAVAALNHPNICQLYDVGPNYLVMEFIEGPPIAPTGDLPTLLDQAMQMADGLTAAHARGITHRDLKPGNILVTRDATREGRVKILDFGLAQVGPDRGGDPNAADAEATLPVSLTEPGTTFGTVAYMSPEQARGQKVDARSDLWSLGVILYETATRVRPFQGPTATVILEALLTREPVPVRERNPNIPAALERIIARLLEKDKETRYQTAADVRADLARVGRDSSATSVPTPPPKPRHSWKYAIAAIALTLGVSGLLLWQRAQGRRIIAGAATAGTRGAVAVPAPPAIAVPASPAIAVPASPAVAKPLTDRDVLVLADFTNTTGDTAFDGALRQALAFELERSPFLKVMDDEDVNQTLQLMSRPAGQRITNDIAHEVCVRAGQKATIGGSIAGLGKTYAIALQAINCQTGATLAREEAEAEDKEHVIKTVAKATTALRAKLGESLSSIQKTERNRGEDDVTTNSLEALKAFQLGFDLMAQAASNREAIPHFQRAIELDPNFASAHMFLSLAYFNTGQPTLEAESQRKAFALVDRVSERERLNISGWYYERVAHDLNKAIDAYQMQVRSYPRAADGYHLLGHAWFLKGEYEKALEQHQESARLAPRNSIIQEALAEDYIDLDRFDEAKAVAERGFAQKLNGPNIHQLLLRIAYIQDDPAAQAREIQWFAGKPDEFQSPRLQGTNALRHGERRKAKELDQGAFEIARRQGVAGVSLLNPAVIDGWVGDCEAARKASIPFVLCLDPSAVRLNLEAAAKNPPPNPDNAGLVYQRGLAALNAGKGTEAAAEFQKILDHKGRNWGPLYSLAWLGVARGEAMAGDTAKAKRAYQDFLALWKDADSDAPFLIQATRELANLN